VAKRLSERYTVVGFDRRAPSHPPPSAECIYVDLTSDPSLRRGLETVRELHGKTLASVLHFAAHYDFSGAPSPLYEEITVGGTRRLLRLLREMDFRVEQFIFSSTMLVHAPTPPRPSHHRGLAAATDLGLSAVQGAHRAGDPAGAW